PGARSQQRPTMTITEKDAIYVADLANLDLTEQERLSLTRDLSSILEYIGRLNELDTTGVPPMAQVSARYGAPEKSGSEQFSGTMRQDLHKTSLAREAALQTAPDS